MNKFIFMCFMIFSFSLYAKDSIHKKELMGQINYIEALISDVDLEDKDDIDMRFVLIERTLDEMRHILKHRDFK